MMIRNCRLQRAACSSAMPTISRGVQALVVEIDGSVTRPDGSIYHITWSLDRAAGRKPLESNAVLLSGWHRVRPIKIALIPRSFD
jgi:hypothetical protein